MREIKFRAWDELNKEMVYPNTTNPKKGFFTTSGVFSSYDTLMQYTGMKDKNGVEIYESDIVKCRIDFWNNRYNFDENHNAIWKDAVSTIIWRGNGFWVEAESFGHEGESLWDWYKMEVIGNIYENPELIK